LVAFVIQDARAYRGSQSYKSRFFLTFESSTSSLRLILSIIAVAYPALLRLIDSNPPTMRYLLLLSSFIGIAAAIQASNFDVNAEIAAQYECGAECQRILQHTNKWDLEFIGTSYDPKFYATASNFSGSNPGDLLKLEVFNPDHIHIPSGITAFRFQYTSLNYFNHTVPVTGFIAFPYTSPFGTDPSHYRTIAFAHGTIGVFAGCAPSATPNFYNYHSWGPIVQAGYAVIASDYAGLGNNATTHEYCAFPALANDLYYSVVAAKRAFGHHLSKQWMSVGHSEGGGVVWKLAEMVSNLEQDSSSAGEYLGTVALAPASKLFNMAEDLLASTSGSSTLSSDSFGEVPWIVLGIQRLLPSFDYALLAPTMKSRLDLAKIAQTCYYGMIGLTLDLKLHQLVSLSAKGLKFLKKFQEMTAPALGDKNHQPILIIQGLDDTSILPKTTYDSWKSSCSFGNELILKQYPGLDHTSVIRPASSTWLSWINDRFEGKETSGNCQEEKVQPFDLHHMKQYSEDGKLASLLGGN
jgi:pimeloyl-ACP methyl ester carboxylesterase